MKNFIKLTDAADGSPVLLAVDHIVAVGAQEGSSVIIMDHEGIPPAAVTESFEAVAALLLDAQAD